MTCMSAPKSSHPTRSSYLPRSYCSTIILGVLAGRDGTGHLAGCTHQMGIIKTDIESLSPSMVYRRGIGQIRKPSLTLMSDIKIKYPSYLPHILFSPQNIPRRKNCNYSCYYFIRCIIWVFTFSA